MEYNDLFKNHYEKLLEIMNQIKVGIYVTDGSGVTLLINDESTKAGKLTKEQVVGRNMKDLVDMGFVMESVASKIMVSGKEESIIQHLGSGGQLFVTGTPVFRNGKIEYIVCTERDLTEILSLKDILKEKESKELKLEKEIEYLRNTSFEVTDAFQTVDMKMKLLAEKALRVARLDIGILLMGESGTGKEVFANLIYRNSSRVGAPYIKINCAAIPESLIESELFGYEKGSFTGADKEGKPGIFELADKGTLFLDEIGELSIRMQSKLLRVLQEKEIMRIGGKKTIPVDVRIIAATNRDLKKEIDTGNFREDLFYRLNIMPITIPPLRERRDDIALLAKNFVYNFSKKYGIQKTLNEDAVGELKKHHWPGNVRELENVMERLVISFDGPEITKFQIGRLLSSEDQSADLIDFREEASLDQMMEDHEKQILSEMMKKYDTATEICRVLNVNKSTLSRRLDKYGLKSKS